MPRFQPVPDPERSFLRPARTYPINLDECRSRAFLLLQQGRISKANFDHILRELSKRN